MGSLRKQTAGAGWLAQRCGEGDKECRVKAVRLGESKAKITSRRRGFEDCGRGVKRQPAAEQHRLWIARARGAIKRPLRIGPRGQTKRCLDDASGARGSRELSSLEMGDLNQGGLTEIYLTGAHGVEDIAWCDGRKILKYKIFSAGSAMRETPSRFLLYTL